jgi:hypothetical protein
MPFDRTQWLDRIKRAEREFRVARLAVLHFSDLTRSDPTFLPTDLRHSDLGRASESLEEAYALRLFALFETALRHRWSTVRPTHPPVSDLIQALASRCRVPEEYRQDVHEVREYRNSLVHEEIASTEPIPIGVVRHRLCCFLSRVY